jgi:hypothetical protein
VVVRIHYCSLHYAALMAYSSSWMRISSKQ